MEKLIFENKEIDISELPKVEDLEFHRVERKYLWILLSRNIIAILILLAASFYFTYFVNKDFDSKYVWFSLAGICALFLLRILFVSIAFKVRAYALRDNDVSYQRGLIFYKQTTVSVNRIQHVEILQSFFMKMMDLASLKIYTAGGSQSDISIAGLPKTKAEEIKALLTDKLSKHE